MKAQFTFRPIYKNTAPCIRISSAKSSHVETLTQEKHTVDCDLDFNSVDTIKIEFLNKDDYDDNVVNIDKIELDGINLQHFILEGVYEPIYNQDWFDSQEVKPPLKFCPGTEMRHLGTWSYTITSPVWKHLMNCWLKDERHGNS